MTQRLSIGYVPLVDAAPLIVAAQMGFAQEEGLSLDLVRAPSWSTLRDMLSFGRVEAAQMLAPVPVATALGLGGGAAALSALMVLSVNGTVIGVSERLAACLYAQGHDFAFDDANAAGAALIAASDAPLRIGVPFPFSMHAELLFYWLSACGLPAPQGAEIRTVPPPLMADAIAAGEIDAFCVGEPWGSKTVELGLGTLLLPGHAIWSFAPEKVLAARSTWAEEEPDLTARLMRAVWKAGRWLGQGGLRTTAAELLARRAYLDISPELIDRALTGELVIRPNGETRRCPRFVEFFDGAATFPWKSQAAWIGDRIARRMGLERDQARLRAQAVFRSDIYRAHLGDIGAVVPGASSKLEGATPEATGAASVTGRLILAENAFFDGQIFDPNQQS